MLALRRRIETRGAVKAVRNLDDRALAELAGLRSDMMQAALAGDEYRLIEFPPRNLPSHRPQCPRADPGTMHSAFASLQAVGAGPPPKEAPVPVDGLMQVPDLPGLGLALNMDFIRERDDLSPAIHT
jgi:hypothetical protein